MLMEPTELFGPEYEDSEQEVVCSVSVSNDPVDIIYVMGQMRMTILPTGGYIIRHVEGQFTDGGSPPIEVVGGEHGLRVRWKSSISTIWTSVPFPFEFSGDKKFATGRDCNIEFTKPHRLQLVPPSGCRGIVKFRILRYAAPPILEDSDG